MKLLSLVFVLIAAIAAALPASAVVLELRDQQTLASSSLTLNDLLSSSQGLTSDDLAIVIAAAPALGASETWTRDRITTLLPDSIKAQGVTWQGSTSCLIKRPSVQYGEAEVRQLITAELARRLPPQSKFEVLELPNVQTFPIPDGTPDATVELTPNSMRNEWGEATLMFREQGQVAVTKSVRFHWSYTRSVWQATDRIAGGDELNAARFQQIEINVLKLPGQLQPATDFPDGKVAARILQAGKILMENDWVEPVLVARNDLVTILYDHHGVSITVQAKAMANGVRNEVIEVQNVTSHKIFNARVVDERTLVYDE